MKDKIQAWEVITFLIGCLIVGYFTYTHVDWKGLFNPPKFPAHVQKKMNLLKLRNIKLVRIPDDVYESFEKNPEEADVFQGKIKTIAAFMPTGCPYREAFNQKLDEMLSLANHKQRYHQRMIETGMTISASCNGTMCPKMWLLQNCADGLCIINPVTREAVIDTSRDVRQIPFLLTALKEW